MNSQDKQVIIRPTSGDDVREYHLVGDQTQITNSKLPYAEFWHPMHGSESEFAGLSAVGKKLASSLMAESNEESITRITLRPQSFRVYKTPTASWASVENDIVIRALEDLFGAGIQPVQYGTTRQRELAIA